MCALRLFAAITILAGAFYLANAQGVNSIRISPSEPTSLDTILVISDFSYFGACEYGLVYDYSHVDDTSVLIVPTYCGYFLPDSVLCQSVDTFKVGPLTAGTYALNIDYHQGSVCPLSGFDATIAEFDTTLVIVGTNAISDDDHRAAELINIYPNPASETFIVSIQPFEQTRPLYLCMRNILGQIVMNTQIDEMPFEVLSSQLSGLFLLSIVDQEGNQIGIAKVLIQ